MGQIIYRESIVFRGSNVSYSLACVSRELRGALRTTRVVLNVCVSDTVFVTLFPTTVETVTTPVLAILTFYRFGGQISLCEW